MKSRGRINLRPALVVLLVVVAAADVSPIFAATADAPSHDPASCLELVRETTANEIAANNSSAKHMFRARKQTPQGTQTRLYVETRDAMAGMTIAYNDKPLAPQDVQNENGRLAGLASNAEQLRRKHAQEQENADRTLRIVKALPDAFLYQYDGEEAGDDHLGGPGRTLLRLKFRPNPAYQPPTHAEQVLVGMNGFLVIDPVAHRIAQMDGTLFREVTFGWGILGHLDQGGHFLVEQRDVGNGSWEVSHMSLNFTGKILLLKSLAIKSEEEFSDFRRVPDGTTFAQGVELLKEEEVKLAQNHFAETIKTANKSH
ncbi:MAG TPA: hypothetical protein VFF50_12830 [Candidatus Deferrimicrobiaceae bacterium]|nr:hypothetical protein [Candidatus Deferrimicrobiaceae bacterium]